MCPSKIYFLFYIGKEKSDFLLVNWSPRIKAFSSLQSRWLCPCSLINGKLPETFLNGWLVFCITFFIASSLP